MDDIFDILLVEDQPKHQKIYQQALEADLPVHVQLAANGEQALAIMQKDPPPGLIILDLDMPGRPGRDVLAHIRSNQSMRHIPIIILTGSSDLEIQMKLLEEGADDFIEKGATPEIVVARVKAQMRHRLATNRLQRLALDRDIFAAGVLQDIKSIETTITSLCRQARQQVEADPVANRAQIFQILEALCASGSSLGNYASDIIQSVRESRQGTEVGPQDLSELFDWVSAISAQGHEDITLEWKLEATLIPVMGDRSLLRHALIAIAKRAAKQRRGDLSDAVRHRVVRLHVCQRVQKDAADRTFITTCIRDEVSAVTERDLEKLFMPYSLPAGEAVEQEVQTEAPDLSLFIVSRVINNMGGRVWAEIPKSGPGMVICFNLPPAPKP